MRDAACFLFQRVKKVIGIELCKEAIEDAKVNAELNGKALPLVCMLSF